MDFSDIDAFTALLTSGNTAPAQTLVWDGENRLTEWRPTFPANTPNAQKVTCSYDYQGRRVEKKVYNWVSGQWQTTPSLHRKFVWSGWLMLLELNGLSEDAVVRKYTWGLDLAGQSGAVNSLEGAGGIGGLLAVEQPQTVGDSLRYVYLYDGNGNVGQVIDPAAASATAALKAKYEYDPYGRRTNLAPFEYDQPFRFSTKYFDAETGFLYFGGRHYQPSLGRWLNRDPIEEAGGPNLYAFAGNDPIDRIDPLGYVCGPNPEDCGVPGGTDGGPWACQKSDDPKPPPKPAQKPTSEPGKPSTQPRYIPCKDAQGVDRDCGQAVCTVVCNTPRKDGQPFGGETVCDGKGGACCCICPQGLEPKRGPGKDTIDDPDVFNAFVRCTGAHEGSHVGDNNKADPSPCKDKDGNPKPAGTAIPPTAEGECDAYDREFECIANSVPKDCVKRTACQAALAQLLADTYTSCLQQQQCNNKERCDAAKNKALVILKKRAGTK